MDADAAPSKSGRISSRVLLFVISPFLYTILFNKGSFESIYSSIAYGTEKNKFPLLDICGLPVNAAADAERGTAGGDEERKQKFCSDEHRSAIEFCSRDKTNNVLPREDVNLAREPERRRSWGILRPYTISPVSEDRPLPLCRSLDHYLSSIKFGKRVATTNTTENADDRGRSIFIPFDCFVPQFPPPPNNTCGILSQYNHVIFHGDSLARHLRLAIYMSMRGNFIEGTVVKGNLEKCLCDGQFSESKVCRTYEGYFQQTIRPQQIAGENLCLNADPFLLGKPAPAPFRERRGEPNPFKSVDWSSVDCAEADYRGILLVLQGGLHYAMNATETFQKEVQPVVTHPTFRECECVGKVRLVWLSANAQSRALDEKYPHQSREKAITFNEEIRDSFLDIGFMPGRDVVILDWWNMTAEAQSVDGLHYMTDVNLAKASQILYLAERWPFPKPLRTTVANSTAFRMPRQFTGRDGNNITIPEGTPLPPVSFYRQHGIHFHCDV